MSDKDFLHRQLIKLGDMMGDGLHHESDGYWIKKEYAKIVKILYPKSKEQKEKELSDKNKKILAYLETAKCSQCQGKLAQKRYAAMTVYCIDCKAKHQLKFAKRKRAK
jgi:hypothetical protein